MAEIVKPNQETPEQKKERYAVEFLKFFDEMRENGLVPEKMFQHGNEFDVTPEGETNAVLSRPFGVFRVAGLEQKLIGSHERAIYKTEIESPDAEHGHGIDREIAFYERFLPKIKTFLPAEVRDQVAFPKLLKVFENNGRPKAMMMTELNGNIMGVHDYQIEGRSDETDFHRIIELVKAVQQLDPAELAEVSASTKTQDDQEVEQKKLDEKIESIQSALGDAYVEKAHALTAQSYDILAKQPERVLSEDVFQTNLMVLPDGRTASFDWERLKIGKNPGHDYSKFASRLWTEPEKMNQFIRMVREANKGVEGFDIMFRSNLLTTELTHFLRHYSNVIRKHEADAEKFKDRPQLVEQAKKAVPVFTEAIRDLLDGIGPWENLPENN